VSPRRARRREDEARPLRTDGDAVTESRADGEWLVRPITAEAAAKVYRCPGCDHEIPARTPHVVAWRIGEEDNRRHWHTPCWSRSKHGVRHG